MVISLKDGLSKLDTDLEKLVGNPKRLELDRSRFNKTPEGTPPQSGTTTVLSYSPKLDPDEPLAESWEFYVDLHRIASRPRDMFHMLTEIERSRLYALHSIYRGPPESAPPGDYLDVIPLARRKIRQRWIDQGIWHDSWIVTDTRIKLGQAFKHEAAFKDDSDVDSKCQKTEEEKRVECDASRPLNQFLYELRREQEWYEECREAGADNVPSTKSEIETRSYNTVLQRWRYYHLWDERWDRLPGLAWRHEMPLEDLVKQKLEDHPALISMSDAQRRSIDSHRSTDSLNEPKAEVVFKPTRQERPNSGPIKRPQAPAQPSHSKNKNPNSNYRQPLRLRLRRKLGFFDTPRYPRTGQVIPVWSMKIKQFELRLHRQIQ